MTGVRTGVQHVGTPLFFLYRNKEMTDNNKLCLLSAINDPTDLRQLPIDKLPEVCDELRQDIVHELAENPGHLASSLGVVELTVALHYVFNTPYDRVVWDVGHQAYGHKILTGRREAFYTNRQLHGIRPFPAPRKARMTRLLVGMLPTRCRQHWAWP